MNGDSKWGVLGQYDWSIMAPELTILVFATLLSIIDLLLPKKTDRRIIGVLGLVGVIVSLIFTLSNTGMQPESIMADMYRLDSFAVAFKAIFLIGVAFAFLMSLGTLDKKDVHYHGEFYYLLLTALLGAMFMASSADLITLFIGLELLSISSFIMVGLRKRNIQSNESAFKYVVIGSISAAVTLYGMSFIYGLTGTTNLYLIAERLGNVYQGGFSYIVYLAFFLMFVGLSFKISAVPNQSWAPDVYQGAPTPVTAFLSVVSKAAGFAIILRIFIIMLSNVVDINMTTGEMKSLLVDNLALYLGIVAAASMIIGNTMALRQVNMKRMMAYSGIAQAGYLLVPFATFTVLLFEQTLFYLIAYLFANMGIFAIMALVAKDQGHDEIRGFAGLFQRAPLLAITMTIFLLSLAGIPVTAGFFGKFYIFLSSVARQNYWLAGIMMATSVVSYVYYFGVMKQMFMRTNSNGVNKIKVPPCITIALVIALAVTLLAGIFPGEVIDYLHNNFIFENMMQSAEQVVMNQ